MTAKHNILKMAHHIARRGEGYPDRRIMHPARDWFIGLSGTALLFLGSSMYTGHLFWSRSNTATEIYTVTIDSVHYDPKLIGRVLTDYRARQARYELLRGNIISVPEATSTAMSIPTPL